MVDNEKKSNIIWFLGDTLPAIVAHFAWLFEALDFKFMALAIYKWCNLLKFGLMLMALLLIISLLFILHQTR
jgi:hypothetical protein